MDERGLPQRFLYQGDKVLQTELLVYECEGTEEEIKEWFKTINIAGIPLNQQELLNAVYSGPFVTLAKAEFSNSRNALVQKWSAYITGVPNRQDFLERALEWVSHGHVGAYMSEHRFDDHITELRTYFNTVIDWIGTVFRDVESEMRGQEWGRLYETYHTQPYDPAKVSEELHRLYADPYVKNRRGVFEFILGGCIDTKLLDIRIFDAYNIHIHVPEGAVPKDGPSAGITMATSLVSALTQRKVRRGIAMTGEITLRGKVLPVGGIKEKILAAKRAGITDIILCADNRKDIEAIEELYLKGLTFHYVENVLEVLELALLKEQVDHPIQFKLEENEKEGK